MTIKIIKDYDYRGNNTEIFSCDSIKYYEDECTVRDWHLLKESSPYTKFLGGNDEGDEEHKMIIFDMRLYDMNSNRTTNIIITPTARCFIINNQGNTIETLHARIVDVEENDKYKSLL